MNSTQEHNPRAPWGTLSRSSKCWSQATHFCDFQLRDMEVLELGFRVSPTPRLIQQSWGGMKWTRHVQGTVEEKRCRGESCFEDAKVPTAKGPSTSLEWLSTQTLQSSHLGCPPVSTDSLVSSTRPLRTLPNHIFSPCHFKSGI